jgi:hypothetical protein
VGFLGYLAINAACRFALGLQVRRFTVGWERFYWFLC